MLARPAASVSFSRCRHLAVVLNPVALRCGAAALMPKDDGGRHARLRDYVICQGKRGLGQFKAPGRAILGHRLRACGYQKVNFGEDVF